MAAKKYVDSEALKELVKKVGEAVGNGKWLNVRNGEGKWSVSEGGFAIGMFSHSEGSSNYAKGNYSHVEGSGNTVDGHYSHAEGINHNVSGEYSHAEGNRATVSGYASHGEGQNVTASGDSSHAEGESTIASGYASHAEGSYNYPNTSFISMLGVGNDKNQKLNAEAVYVERKGSNSIDTSAPKNGYKYLLGVGGYTGQEIGDAKSVQEVFADIDNNMKALPTEGVVSNEEIDALFA